MAQTDKKQRNLIIAISIMTLAIVSAIGLAVWALSGKSDEKVNSGNYATNTPTTQTVAQQVGSVAITPEEIALQRTPDGKFGANVTISALFQNFTVGSIKVNGDSRITTKGDCPASGSVLESGHRCQLQLTLDPTTLANQATTNVSPTLVVTGETLTPGGSKQLLETSAKITGVAPGDQPAALPGATGQVPGAEGGVAGGSPLTSGQVAPTGIDPYGPVAPNATPPVNYAQGGQQVAPQQRVLSPREQFILARRQAVLGNVVRDGRQQAPQQVAQGTWDEIGVKKAVSSLPQDMSRVVTQDRIITAVLMRPFDSRQTMRVVAQVDRNVYGAMGRNILIPRGSTVIGTMTAGAERAGVIWDQIIRPDGARFVFQGQGGDAMGQGGVPGNINNRWARRLSIGFLGTLLKVLPAVITNPNETAGNGGVSIGNGGNSGVARNKGAIITDIISQDITSQFQPLISQAQSIQPIVTIPAGTRMTIVPSQDLVMHEVQRETIVRQQYPRQMNGGAQISASPYQGGQDVGGLGGAGGSGSDFIGGGQPAQQQYAPRQTSQQGNVVAQGIASRGAPATLGATPPWGSN